MAQSILLCTAYPLFHARQHVRLWEHFDLAAVCALLTLLASCVDFSMLADAGAVALLALVA